MFFGCLADGLLLCRFIVLCLEADRFGVGAGGIYGCFHKWWYPTTMGFPTKNDHFGVFWGYPYFRKHPYMDTYSFFFGNLGFPTLFFFCGGAKLRNNLDLDLDGDLCERF